MGNNANENNIFNRLVNDLSNTEKSVLLTKLLKYTDVPAGNDEKEDILLNPEKIKNDGLEYAKKEFSKYSLFHKIIIYILSFFKGNTVEDVIIDNQIDSCKKEINITCCKYINLEEKKLKITILDKIIPIMLEVEHLKNNLKRLFDDKMMFFQFLEFLVETDKKEELNTLLPVISPVNIDNGPEFLEKNQYNTEKEKRIKLYFAKVAKLNLNDFHFEVSKLNILLKCINYDFRYLTNLFGVIDLDNVETGLREIFITEDILVYLQRLDMLMISMDKNILEMKTYHYFLEFINTYCNTFSIEEVDVKVVNESFLKILGNLEEIKQSFFIEKIIKVLKRNLFYYTEPFNIKINVFDMYKTYKLSIIDKLWENSYKEIRERSVKHLIAELYDNYSFNSLEYLTIELKEKLEKYSGGVKIKDFYILNILHKFLSSTYQERIFPILTKIILEGNFLKDIVKSNFASAYYSLKNADEKIIFFDQKFKEGTSLQKKINSAIIKAAAESNFKSIVINVVIDINDESEKIKAEIIESLKMVSTILSSLCNLTNNNSPQKILSNFDDLKMPIFQNPILACDTINKELEKILKIFKLVEETF